MDKQSSWLGSATPLALPGWAVENVLMTGWEAVLQRKQQTVRPRLIGWGWHPGPEDITHSSLRQTRDKYFMSLYSGSETREGRLSELQFPYPQKRDKDICVAGSLWKFNDMLNHRVLRWPVTNSVTPQKPEIKYRCQAPLGKVRCPSTHERHTNWFWSKFVIIVVVQLLSRVQLFATPWTAAHQASLSFTISRSLLRLMSIESGIQSNHLILCWPLLLLLSIFPSIRPFISGGQSIGSKFGQT